MKYAPKPVEICIMNDNYSAQCTDLRLKKEDQNYKRDVLENYICTNPSDEEYLYNYASDLRERLIKCETRK